LHWKNDFPYSEATPIKFSKEEFPGSLGDGFKLGSLSSPINFGGFPSYEHLGGGKNVNRIKDQEELK